MTPSVFALALGAGLLVAAVVSPSSSSSSMRARILARIATGDERRDRYDNSIAIALERVQAPEWSWRLVKVMAWRESAAWRAIHGVHDDGLGLGAMGIHRQYFAADRVDPDPRFNPARYTERQLLDDVSANVEVGARLLLWLVSMAGDVWTAVEQFNRGRGGASAPGPYAARTETVVRDWFGGL